MYSMSHGKTFASSIHIFKFLTTEFFSKTLFSRLNHSEAYLRSRTLFRDEGGGVNYLESFQTDYDSLKTPVWSFVWALRIKYQRLMSAQHKDLSSSIFSLVTTSRHTSLTRQLEPVWKLAAKLPWTWSKPVRPAAWEYESLLRENLRHQAKLGASFWVLCQSALGCFKESTCTQLHTYIHTYSILGRT